MLETSDGNTIIKHKGPAKDFVTSDWFKKVYADLSATDLIPTEANFRIDWKQLDIIKKKFILKLGLPKSEKREYIFDSNNIWIDTRPKEVIDLGSKDATTILKLSKMRNNDASISQSSNNTEEKSTNKENNTDEINTNTISEDTKKPTLFINKPKKSNKEKSTNQNPKPDE